MANMRIDEDDRDSAYGGDDDFLWEIDAMVSPPQLVAGTKRKADDHSLHAAASGLSLGSGSGPKGYPCEHIDPRVLCCTHCPEPPCPEPCSQRATKRRASATAGSECHALAVEPNMNADCQFLDHCFEESCGQCTLESCPPDCASPCRGESCPEDDACCDPLCSRKSSECADGCVDPECTKLACPDQPCFCQKCDAQPCPLGDPNNECHFAHSAPTPVGTIYCYDNAPCHFQEGYHGQHDDLASFESYPCFSQNHAFTHRGHLAAPAPTTPTLSRSNYSSVEQSFVNETPTAPAQANVPNCYLNISSAHCHLDNSCCHGAERACGNCPSASKQQLDLWNALVNSGNGLADDLMTFGFGPEHSTHSTSMKPRPITSNSFNHADAVFLFDDQSWMPTDSSISAFQTSNVRLNKPSFLTPPGLGDMPRLPMAGTIDSVSPTKPGVSNETSIDVPALICKWQHAPGVLCLAVFDTPEALHKHIKTAHVDNCMTCCCKWEGCDVPLKDFKQRSKLSRHLLGHAGHRPYACSYPGCDKAFATNQAKDNHERTHTGEKPYVCDRCGYTTTTHTQLQTHISALHEGKKPHKCRFCDFTCADSSNLSKHERTHQTLRPYRCPHPSCTFKPDCRWENLKRHLRRSGHCPQLLDDESEECKAYRENVRRETEMWHSRNEDGSASKTGRRKGRS